VVVLTGLAFLAALLFVAPPATASREASLVKDMNPGSESSFPAGLTAFGGRLYFAADDDTSGRELWQTDGTEAGTTRVKDIYPGSGSSHASGLTAFRGGLYFAAEDGTSGTELWKLAPAP